MAMSDKENQNDDETNHMVKVKMIKMTDNPASILYKSIAGRYRPVSYPDGPITAHYRFIKNASWYEILMI